MWTISDEQLQKTEASMQDEYMRRVCKFVSDDNEFAWMPMQRIREDAENILDQRMQELFKDEKWAAEFVKFSIKQPEIINVPYNRDIRLILEDNELSAKEKIDKIDYYINS